MLLRLSSNVIAAVALAAVLSPAALFAGRGEELNAAICDRDLGAVKRILAAGQGVNERMGENGSYPLELASYCYGGAPEIADYLITRGANVNLHNTNHYSPLMWALRSVDSNTDRDPMRKVVKRMIEKGAKVDYHDPTHGRTPLMMAASNGDAEIVKILMRKGASNKPKTRGDWCVSGNYDIQCTASDYARLGGHVELALDMEGKSSAAYKQTLHFAAKNGDTAKLQSLIKAGKDVNEEEQLSKYTPLYYAVTNNHSNVVRALADAGANMNSISYSGTTPLREAVVYYKKDIAKLLIDNGAKAGHAQTQGCGGGLTEFGWAIEYGQHDIAKYMIDKGAVNAQNPGLAFQEMYGRSDADIPVAQLLIDRGGRPDTNDIDRLKLIATNNDWIRQAGHNAKLVAMYEDALNKPAPVADNDEDENATDITDVMPDIPEHIFQMRMQSTPPPEVKHRSMKAKQAAEKQLKQHRSSLPAKARSFDAQYRGKEGRLSADPMR